MTTCTEKYLQGRSGQSRSLSTLWCWGSELYPQHHCTSPSTSTLTALGLLCPNRGSSRSHSFSLSLHQSSGNLHGQGFAGSPVSSFLWSTHLWTVAGPHKPWTSPGAEVASCLLRLCIVYSLHSSSALGAELGLFPNQLHDLSCSNSTFCTLSCIPDFKGECFCCWF